MYMKSQLSQLKTLPKTQRTPKTQKPKKTKIGEAKNNLSRYIQYVRRGGRVRIYDRDTPVADIVPIGGLSVELEEDEAGLLASMLRRGVVRKGKHGPLPKELWRPGPRLAGAISLSQAIVSERRQGR